MTEEKIILEIGCGDKQVYPNSITLDIRKTPLVDIIADARALPFKEGSIDYLFSSHVIEHFSHRETDDIAKEWIRVIKVGGVVELRCPDLRARALLFFFNPSLENIHNIYGEQDYSANFHKCGFSYSRIKELFSKFGIKKIHRIYDGAYGIPLIPCDLHIKGVKDGRSE